MECEECSNDDYWLSYDDCGCHEYWVKTTESFIFSLGDGKDLRNARISRVSNDNYAIYEQKYSLDFGNCDLVIYDREGTCNKGNYERRILNVREFLIQEMEIFTVHHS